MNKTYYQKYIKYKTKYLQIKSQEGGHNPIQIGFGQLGLPIRTFILILPDIQEVAKYREDYSFPRIDDNYLTTLIQYVKDEEIWVAVDKKTKKDVTLKERTDIVLKIDCTHVTWTSEDLDKKDTHLKRGVYQAIQAIECLNSNGVYTKEGLVNLYPKMYNFLFRKEPTNQDFIELNNLFKVLVDIIRVRANNNIIDINIAECDYIYNEKIEK